MPPRARTGIQWITPPSALADAVERYGDRVIVAVTAVAQRIATIMQDDAKANAAWTDRTGNARSGLFGTAERDAAEKVVTLYLSHGAQLDYGIWLELANEGKHSIIMKTVEAHLPELKSELDALLK